MSLVLAKTLAQVVSPAQAAQLIKSAPHADLEALAGGIRAGRRELLPRITERLLSMLPTEIDPVEAELMRLLGEDLPNPPKRSKQAKSAAKSQARTVGSKLSRKPAAKPATKSGETIRHNWSGQAPVSQTTGKTLPWVVSAGQTDSGTFLNIGWRGMRSIGATIETWREVLSNADELLADLEAFQAEIE